MEATTIGTTIGIMIVTITSSSIMIDVSMIGIGIATEEVIEGKASAVFVIHEAAAAATSITTEITTTTIITTTMVIVTNPIIIEIVFTVEVVDELKSTFNVIGYRVVNRLSLKIRFFVCLIIDDTDPDNTKVISIYQTCFECR